MTLLAEPPRDRRSPDPARAWQVLAVSAAAVYVVFLDATIVNIAFPAISADFADVSRGGLCWVINAYAVVFGALLVTAGGLADDFGRKRVFLVGLGVFAAGSALCGIAPSVDAPRRCAGGPGDRRCPPRTGLAGAAAAGVPAVQARQPRSGLWGAAGAVAARQRPVGGRPARRGPRVALGLLRQPAVLPRRRLVRPPDPRPSRPGQRPRRAARPARRRAGHGRLRAAVARHRPGRGVGLGERRASSAAFAVAAVLAPVLVCALRGTPRPALPVRLFRVRSFSVATVGHAAVRHRLLRPDPVQRAVPQRGLGLLDPAHRGRDPALARWSRPRSRPLAGRLADRYGYRAVIAPGAALFALGAGSYAVAMTADPALRHALPARRAAGGRLDRRGVQHARRRQLAGPAAGALRRGCRGELDRPSARRGARGGGARRRARHAGARARPWLRSTTPGP